MKGEKATLLVRCRFPTGKGNRVRIVIDGETAGELECHLKVSPGEHQIRVTSWGLPLCGPMEVSCPAGASVELALQVCFSGLIVGIALFLVAMLGVGMVATFLAQLLPGKEILILPVVACLAIAVCLFDFYLLLPQFSLYTFRLVER